MDHQTFSDGIGRIAVIDGIVRLDLVAYSPAETDAKGNARAVVTHRLVMGVDAFLRASDKMVETVKLIKQAQGAQQPQQQPAPQAVAQPVERPRPWERPQEVPLQFRRESVRADTQYPADPASAAIKRPFP
jgi:hypothetical protein